jgi:hypothetical protein
MNYSKQIARGAELLDKLFPDWEWKINLDELRLDSCALCVVGQLTGGFDTDVTFGWELMTQEEIKHGFYVEGDSQDPKEYWRLWHALTAEWKEFILERRRSKSRTNATTGTPREAVTCV